MSQPTYQSDLQRRLGLSDEEYRQIEAAAAAEDRTVAAEIRRRLRSSLRPMKRPSSRPKPRQ